MVPETDSLSTRSISAARLVGRKFEDELVLRLALDVEADADQRVLAGPQL